MEAGSAPMTEEVFYNGRYKIFGTEEQLRDCYGFSENMIDDIIKSSMKTTRIVLNY